MRATITHYIQSIGKVLLPLAGFRPDIRFHRILLLNLIGLAWQWNPWYRFSMRPPGIRLNVSQNVTMSWLSVSSTIDFYWRSGLLFRRRTLKMINLCFNGDVIIFYVDVSEENWTQKPFNRNRENLLLTRKSNNFKMVSTPQTKHTMTGCGT